MKKNLIRVFIFLILVLSCQCRSGGGTPSEADSMSVFREYLASIRDADFEAFLELAKIDRDYSKETFEGYLLLDKFTREVIEKFGFDSLSEVPKMNYGQFARGALVTDFGALKSREGGIRLGEENGFRVIEIYPIGIFLLSRYDGRVVVDLDAPIYDYERFMNSIFRPMVLNTESMRVMLQDDTYGSIGELLQAFNRQIKHEAGAPQRHR